MLTTPDQIPSETLRRLHRSAISAPARIRAVLEGARDHGCELRGGINRRSSPETARIEAIESDRLRLATSQLTAREGRQLSLTFVLDDSKYFLAAETLKVLHRGRIEIALPRVLYLAEQRDTFRLAPATDLPAPRRVVLCGTDGRREAARVADWSVHGLGVEVPESAAPAAGEQLRIEYLDGAERGSGAFADVRHTHPSPERTGFTRVGLSVSRVSAVQPVPLERLDLAALLGRPGPVAGAPTTETTSEHVAFTNDRGERLCALIDRWGDPRGATAVVIPPAWGRTKETLLPLAATIVESFRAAGEPVTVLRFDGTRRRGESFRDAECQAAGSEELCFMFSQAVRDTQACVDYLNADAATRPSTVILVTFSLAAVEGRRVVSENLGRRIGGWVSVAGVPDLQSALHLISGGVDYGYGLLRGVDFGNQLLFGVLADIDHSGWDAIEHGLSSLEDARRDMAAIDVPVTWVHGRYDAWVDLERVRDLLARGVTGGRRLVEIPTGHQLRTSREAIAAFGFVAGEVARMALGRTTAPVAPDPTELERRRKLERKRLPRTLRDLRPFWRDYLMGTDGRLGIELLTATQAYREFMGEQVSRLALAPGARVCDLGSGTGDFPQQLAEAGDAPRELRITSVDFVPEALQRARRRLGGLSGCTPAPVRFVCADLDLPRRGGGFPLGDAVFDAVLASLFISYVRRPDRLLGEIHRVLAPGGVLVCSSLRRDADISKIYVDSLPERYSERPVEAFGRERAEAIDGLLPGFLGSAARIIDLEERGRFRFFDPAELVALLQAAGFGEITASMSLGSPPQAVIARARRV